MAHVVGKTSADIADRVALHALEKLHMHSTARGLLLQGDYAQTDGLRDNVKRMFIKTYNEPEAVRNARAEGDEKLEKICEAYLQLKKEDQLMDGVSGNILYEKETYTSDFVAQWVFNEIQTKVNAVHDTYEALKKIYDSNVINKFKSSSNEYMRTASILFFWGIVREQYHIHFSEQENESWKPKEFKEITNKLFLVKTERKVNATLNLVDSVSMNEFDNDANSQWKTAFSEISDLQKHIRIQWDWFNTLLLLSESDEAPNWLKSEKIGDVRTILSKHLRDVQINKDFGFEIQTEPSVDPNQEQHILTRYCGILINYIPLCYATGYLSSKNIAKTDLEGLFCVLDSTDKIKEQWKKEEADAKKA